VLWGKTKDLSASSEFVSAMLCETENLMIFFTPTHTFKVCRRTGWNHRGPYCWIGRLLDLAHSFLTVNNRKNGL